MCQTISRLGSHCSQDHFTEARVVVSLEALGKVVMLLNYDAENKSWGDLFLPMLCGVQEKHKNE